MSKCMPNRICSAMDTAVEADTAPLHRVDATGQAHGLLKRWGRIGICLLTICLVLVLAVRRPALPPPRKVPSRPLSGGGSIPALLMGGDDFSEWFEAAGSGAAIQTFYSYGNGPHIAPQLRRFGRSNVFVSTGIPCGCCGADSPSVEPMNASLAMSYIDRELAELQTGYADLLLFHHRCRTESETASVWEAFEAAKRQGKARHLGVSNFNAHDLEVLSSTAVEPIEVLEAHFGVGMMDWEVLGYARAHGIHPVAFASLSEAHTDHPTLQRAVSRVATAHGVTATQAMYAYLLQRDLSVISSCFHPEDPQKCARYYSFDLAALDVSLSAAELEVLDGVTAGRRTCTDCYTDECQRCAATLHALGCPLGVNGWGTTWWSVGDNFTEHPAWGRGNENGTRCMACAAVPSHRAEVERACGRADRGESLETMVPKACGV